jgi:hypothetical protein
MGELTKRPVVRCLEGDGGIYLPGNETVLPETGLAFGGDLLYNHIAMGMTGFDGRGWSQIASREAPTSRNQRKKQVPIAQTFPLCPSPPKR